MNSLKIIGIYTFLFLPAFTYAQTAKESTAVGKDTINVLNSHSNSLYAGIDNYVEINRKTIKYKQIIVEVAKGMVMEDENLYIVMVGRPGTTTISLYQYDNGDTLLFAKKTMIVKAVPAPFISFNGKNLNELTYITKSDLKKNKNFEVHLSNDFVEDSEWFKIQSFTIGYTYGQQYISKTCEGASLTNEIISILDRLAPGKEIVFAFILEGSGDMFKRLEPIRLKLY